MPDNQTSNDGKPFVRTAKVADEAAVSNICLKTADSGQDASKLFSLPELPGLVWVVPYLYYSLSHCFVAEHEGRVVGYLVTVPNTRLFKEWLSEKWLAEFKRRTKGFEPKTSQDEDAASACDHYIKLDQHYLDTYPAHLHINLLPDAQGTGLGRKLVKTALANLRRENVHAIHLGVAPKNTRAIGFYEAMGFSRIENAEGYIMGKSLINEGE